jgi:hypothetical protein
MFAFLHPLRRIDPLPASAPDPLAAVVAAQCSSLQVNGVVLAEVCGVEHRKLVQR